MMLEPLDQSPGEKATTFHLAAPKPVTQLMCIVQFCYKDDEQMLPFPVTIDRVKINQLF